MMKLRAISRSIDCILEGQACFKVPLRRGPFFSGPAMFCTFSVSKWHAEQVAEMVNALCDGTGAPLLKASVVLGGQGWPITPPDLVTATPVALMNHLFAFDPRRRRRNAFIRDVKYVVFDEADMLLSGGFENQVIRLLNLLRFEEKQLSKLKSQEAMLATVESQPLDARPWTEFMPVEVTSEDVVATEDLEGSLESDEDQQAESSDSGEDEAPHPGRNQKRDWFKTRKLYTRSK